VLYLNPARFPPVFYFTPRDNCEKVPSEEEVPSFSWAPTGKGTDEKNAALLFVGTNSKGAYEKRGTKRNVVGEALPIQPQTSCRYILRVKAAGIFGTLSLPI
jgi:hypothetical protein